MLVGLECGYARDSYAVGKDLCVYGCFGGDIYSRYLLCLSHHVFALNCLISASNSNEIPTPSYPNAGPSRTQRLPHPAHPQQHSITPAPTHPFRHESRAHHKATQRIRNAQTRLWPRAGSRHAYRRVATCTRTTRLRRATRHSGHKSPALLSPAVGFRVHESARVYAAARPDRSRWRFGRVVRVL
jgi:hypothetical protein